MNLAEIEPNIISWAIDNNIKIFHGTIYDKKGLKVDWIYPDKYQDFLDIALFKGVKLLILYTAKFNVEEEIDINEIEVLEDSKLKEKLKVEYNALKKYKDYTGILEISWILESIIYQCVLEDNLSLKIDYIKKELESSSDSDFDQAPSIRRFGSSMPDKSKISAQKSKEIALQLAAHPDFYIIRYDYEKQRALISKMLEDDGAGIQLDHMDKTLLIGMADTYFNEKYLIVREKEIGERVIELKLQGLSKIAVRGKLGMSESMINKFWYNA